MQYAVHDSALERHNDPGSTIVPYAAPLAHEHIAASDDI